MTDRMSDRHITIPSPAEFRDAHTKERVKVKNERGVLMDHPDRTHDWFMHAHILSHIQFSLDVGGHEAVRAGKEIARSLDKAMDSGASSYPVTTDQWNRLNCCIACPASDDEDERMKEKPNPRILAKSSHGMTRELDNFSASCFMDHLDAIANASTNKPE